MDWYYQHAPFGWAIDARGVVLLVLWLETMERALAVVDENVFRVLVLAEVVLVVASVQELSKAFDCLQLERCPWTLFVVDWSIVRWHFPFAFVWN